MSATSCGDSNSDGNPGPGGGVDGGGGDDGSASGGDGSAGLEGGGDGNPNSDSGPITPPGTVCTSAVTLANVSAPTTVVGGASGPPCTQAGLQTALGTGGVITFACGGTVASPFVIKMATELTVDKTTVIDGGGTVVLSGDMKTRILKIGHGDFTEQATLITVQNLTFRDGHTTDVVNTSSTAMGGAAIYRVGAQLTVVDCTFLNNVGPVTGQDVAGGAIYSIGGGATKISGSTFSGNACSNGGALGNLGNLNLTIFNSTFDGNTATGLNANPGNGGNGGAISFDGPASTGCNGSVATPPYTPIDITVCGATFHANHAGVGAFGGAIFRTVDTTCVPKNTGPVTIDKSTFDANTADNSGALYLHQIDLTMTDSTVSNNVAKGAGGVRVEGAAAADVTINFTNVTIANNTATNGLGGGFYFGSNIAGGTLANLTVAGNEVKTTSGNMYAVFGAGFIGTPGTIALYNSIVANNKKPAPASGDSADCEATFTAGSGNVEFLPSPAVADPHKCTSNSTVIDPGLGPLQDNGGPTKTMAVPKTSPAVGKGAGNCPATDQRGMPRTTPCSAGALEP